MPGPTAYDVSRSYQALVAQNKKSPRSIHARKRHSQFLSAAKRIFAGEVTTDTPGPGAYDSLMHSHPHGFASVRAPRFHSQSSKLPGPADYEVRNKLEKIQILTVLYFLSSYHHFLKIQFFVEHLMQH